MRVLIFMYVAFGLLLSVLGIPLWLRKVGPNWFYGFRVRRTLEAPEIWYEANTHAGRGLVADGLIMVLAALVLAAVPGIAIDRYALLVTAILFMALGFTLLRRFSRRRNLPISHPIFDR
jgi:hypothetical protein